MKVLIIDDEKNICTSIKNIVEDEGFEAFYAMTYSEGLDKLKIYDFDVIFLDIWLPDKDGMEGLKEIKKSYPNVEVIMISGHGNIENAVDSVKLGAYDFLEKPLSLERIVVILKHLNEKISLKNDIKELKSSEIAKYQLIGESKYIKDLKATIEKVANTNAWVLITGENGTGKEHVARLIHLLSKRANQKFIPVNCAAIPSELIESELFGYEKGAFTGAVAQKIGKFELADKGTIFLDEIGDMDLSVQAKLLRVLESGEFSRVGGNEIIKSDFRLISATNRDLQTEIENNNFREDLYYRISVVPIYVEPLRKRREDIPILVRHFVKEISIMNGLSPKSVSDALMEVFINYDWPGNVRQLKNIIERMVVLSSGDVLDVVDAPEMILKKGSVYEGFFTDAEWSLKSAKENFEKYYILNVLKKTDWNISKAARILEIERTYLHKKIKFYNLESLRGYEDNGK
ncbi:sigma-54-dependent transcriptional regulator [Calditerrivibrio nitroreducens]|uniref:Two component, sigma54 specific, transcriptional regulator, Fis family n=1 Tax=Calditerrivibrio nitroreducens (strain DSM 19672 / NBRC 101217 / Yu37-1) TaxID=768670 RepID=E4TF26_CALNY|nr:sigma-54 dependent transcriptional regulator [Calditerrivibrio nitroreducens]ADR19466.1 two component, sigma54 specific, transcriptional regulator, Fis family [Calditerrivibrio nitroreducens DSM 19672]